jgi:peptide-methionine (S)-S-oxide reductase
MASAVFGGGCFWCTEAVFEQLKGVQSVVPGYAGGARPNPTYQQVCTGATGHAEVVKIDFDPAVISFRDLLIVHFSTHDPTTMNRQGNDVGTQYRSAVFYYDDAQKADAEAVIAEIAKVLPEPITTQVSPLAAFYEAEEYHHKYFRRNGEAGYCQFVIAPKVEKFQKRFKELLQN